MRAGVKKIPQWQNALILGEVLLLQVGLFVYRKKTGAVLWAHSTPYSTGGNVLKGKGSRTAVCILLPNCHNWGRKFTFWVTKTVLLSPLPESRLRWHSGLRCPSRCLRCLQRQERVLRLCAAGVPGGVPHLW